MNVFLILIVKIIVANGDNGNIPFFLWSNRSNIEENGFTFNKTTNPCNDFYDYTCGSWIERASKLDVQPNWNHWQLTSQTINERLEKILTTTSKSDDKYFRKIQEFYKNCVHNAHLENKYVNNLKNLVRNLKGWPLVDLNWQQDGYNWSIQVAKLVRFLAIYPLLKFHVFIDMKNTSKNILYMERGDLNLPQPILMLPEKFKHFIKSYELWILNTVEYLYPNHTNLKLKKDVIELIEFEIKLAKLYNIKDKSYKSTIDELGKKYPMKWNKIFTKLFYDTSIHLHGNESIIVRCEKYLKQLLVLIANTKTKTIANYIVWTVIKSLSRETSEYMRKLSFTMDTVVFGIKTDFTRKHECLNTVTTYMDVGLISKYNELYIDSQAIKNVSDIIENVKEAFIDTLKRNSWLQSTTKKLAIKKIVSMKYYIGYPNELTGNILEKKFEQVKITNNHFVNVMYMKALNNKYELEKLRLPAKFLLPGSLFEVNAFYSILQNTIFIPVGMLEEPFYFNKGPTNLNYGALGTLIGHEISHSLDTSGRHADSNGNIVDWWTEKDNNKYLKKINCYKHQYEKYEVNAFHTLAENIADNVGLSISLKAFKNLSSDDEHSRSRLFFIGFSQLWCEVPNKSDVIDDEHAPVKTRVLGTLQNNHDFYEAFNCGDDVDKKCVLW